MTKNKLITEKTFLKVGGQFFQELTSILYNQEI